MQPRAASGELLSCGPRRRRWAVGYERVASSRLKQRLRWSWGAGAVALLVALNHAAWAEAAVSFLNATTEQQAWCSARGCVPAPEYSVVVGQEIVFNVTILDDDRNRNISIAVLADPGLPNGARLLPSHHVMWEEGNATAGIRDHTAVTRELRFVPMERQEGLSYEVCFKGFDVDNATLPTVQRCTMLRVFEPAPAFNGSTSSSEMERVVGVNCPMILKFYPVDAGGNNYCMTMAAGRIGRPSESQLPPGAVLRHVSTSQTTKIGTHDGCVVAHWEVAWFPKRGQEARSYSFCVHSMDDICTGAVCRSQSRAQELCYHVAVAKCRYCLSIGETILSAARRYRTDWMQLWAVNSHVKTPDAVGASAHLTLGPTYTVRRGDTLESLAVRFGTTASNILDLNPDVEVVDNAGILRMGDHLCIVPPFCGEMGSHPAVVGR